MFSYCTVIHKDLLHLTDNRYDGKGNDGRKVIHQYAKRLTREKYDLRGLRRGIRSPT